MLAEKEDGSGLNDLSGKIERVQSRMGDCTRCLQGYCLTGKNCVTYI